MTDKNFENINSYSSKEYFTDKKTISFPAVANAGKGRARLFIYFLVLMLCSFSFLVIGFKVSSMNFERYYQQKPISNTNFVSTVMPEQKSDLSGILRSTVNISVFNDNYLSEATGVIISADGYIVTNDHIYQNVAAPTIIVADSEGNRYNAEFIAGDTKYDVSVLKIEATDLPYLSFDTELLLSKGDTIYSVGRSGSVSKGIVSDYIFASSNQTKSVKMIQTDCAVNPGDSGGPVICDGRLVALNCSKSVAIDVEGVSYLLPAQTVSRAVHDLIENGCVTDRAVLGISYRYISEVDAVRKGGVSGIEIQSINNDSDLYGKGFSSGDVITSIDSRPITSESILLDCLESHSAGDEIKLIIRRINGSDREVTVLLSSDSSFSCYVNE